MVQTAVSFDGAGEAEVERAYCALSIAAHGLTAAGAYRFGLADGMAGRPDDHRTFTPYEAHYAYGYAEGAATHPVNDSDEPLEFVVIAEMPLPLGAPVVVAAQGIVGVISGRSTCDRQRWRITWFNRHFWRVQHSWFARSQFEVITSGSAAVAVGNVPPASAA